MSMMMLDRSNAPRPNDPLKPVFASEFADDDVAADDGLYLERDTLLDDDEFFDSSLDDLDDLVDVARDDAWNE